MSIGIPRGGSTSDLLDQGDALGAPIEVPLLKRVAVEIAIQRHARSLDDQRLLTQALGLDTAPEPRRYHGAYRRAVPDDFRRGRTGKGKRR